MFVGVFGRTGRFYCRVDHTTQKPVHRTAAVKLALHLPSVYDDIGIPLPTFIHLRRFHRFTLLKGTAASIGGGKDGLQQHARRNFVYPSTRPYFGIM